MDNLLGLQARLRGDVAARHSPPKPDTDAPNERDPGNEPDPSAEPARPLRLAPEPVTVRHGDVEVTAGEGPTSADRLAALSERLQRVERELSNAMDRLRTAEARYVGDEEPPEPTPEPSDRDTYHRVQELQNLASKRGDRRRR